MDLDPEESLALVSRIQAVPSILEVICRTTGMRFAAIARVTEDRWIACSVRDDMSFGLSAGDELPIRVTFCDRIRDNRTPVMFEDRDADPAFVADPIALQYGLVSYCAYPVLLPDGEFFGTLCAMDVEPRRVITPEVQAMFQLFCELLGFHLDAQLRLETAEAGLREKAEEAEHRERLIAVLSHDLRNPLASLSAGIRMLRRMRAKPEPEAEELLGLMDGSVNRMSKMIGDVTDFARARLGGGFDMGSATGEEVGALLVQVVEELRLVHPARTIVSEIQPARLVCDPSRLSQLVSNLLTNALVHGGPEAEVRLTTEVRAGSYLIRVSNTGHTLPPEDLPNLFKPFRQGSHNGSKGSGRGLGLGLYIAARIAEAHGGTLSAAMADGVTTFTLTLPL